MADVRQSYWILSANSAVRRVLSCLGCQRRQRPPEAQKMADLPEDRVQDGDNPFTRTGVDYFGPFFVKRGRSRVEQYGVIFTCLAVRAVQSRWRAACQPTPSSARYAGLSLDDEMCACCARTAAQTLQEQIANSEMKSASCWRRRAGFREQRPPCWDWCCGMRPSGGRPPNHRGSPGAPLTRPGSGHSVAARLAQWCARVWSFDLGIDRLAEAVCVHINWRSPAVEN